MIPAPIVNRLRSQLNELPELITLTPLALLPSSGQRGARVSGATRTAPLPCRVDVLSVIGPTSAAVHDPHGDQDPTPGLDLLASWARAVIDDRQRANDWTGWARPAGREGERTVSVAVKVLLLHLDFAASRPYARDLAEEIGRLHAHLNRITGWPLQTGPARRRPCPRCHLLTVTVRPDGMRDCSNPDCWAVLSADEYADRAKQTLAALAAA